MLDWTDRHERAFLRCLTQHTLLYTEMVVSSTILFAKDGPARFLDFNDVEHPVAIQLGGSNPADLAICAKVCTDWGYDEINLNVGCPSDRVSAGRFGACLMAEPDLVADCIKSLQDATSLPVTIKHRIGIDDLDSYDLLSQFVEKVAITGCKTFIIHARKAWLKGLSPKENREIPPLRYDVVRQIKSDFPDLEIILNGGVLSVDEAQDHLNFVDGVMIGRAAYETPFVMQSADRLIFGGQDMVQDRFEAIERYLPYVESQLQKDIYLRHMARHLLGLFHGQPGAKYWRRTIGEGMRENGAGVSLLVEALEEMRKIHQNALCSQDA